MLLLFQAGRYCMGAVFAEQLFGSLGDRQQANDTFSRLDHAIFPPEQPVIKATSDIGLRGAGVKVFAGR